MLGQGVLALGGADEPDGKAEDQGRAGPSVIEQLKQMEEGGWGIADWDKKSARFVAEQQTKIGELVLKRETLSDLTEAERVTTLCGYIAKEGLQIFKQYQAFTTLQKRCAIAFDVTGDPAYESTEQHLMASLENWLGPYLSGQTKLENIRKLDIAAILLDQMSYDKKQRLSELAPTALEVPSGSKIKIDYSENPPVLAVKLQEMFGCDETPSIGGGNRLRLAVIAQIVIDDIAH